MSVAEDQNLVDLFRDRQEEAIQKTASTYGKYLHSISFRVVENPEDAEECVNEALWKAWETIPPFLPDSLRHYLGKLVRTSSLDVLRKKKAWKRNHPMTHVLLECIQCETGNPEQIIDKTIIGDCISTYLHSQKKEKQFLFVRRYYYGDSIKTLAKHQGISENQVKVTLHRMRKDLKKALEEEGVWV